jgi:hypothetical protein
MTLRNTSPQQTRCVFTVAEFCEAHRICRAHLYDLWREGTGPRFMLAGTKKLISFEAAADWRRQRETATEAA